MTSHTPAPVLPVRYVEVAGKQDAGCPDKNENLSSDLCAQWKAADAARNAADYASWGIWLSLIGTTLIVWTFWETRHTSRLELRAYVTHKDTETNYFMEGGRLESIEFVFAWRNSGPTPAMRVRSSINRHWFSGTGLPRDFDFPDIIAPAPLKHGQVMGPGLIMETPIMVPVADLKLNQKGVTFFYGWVEYDDIYLNRRRTEFCFELKFLGDGGIAKTFLRLPSRGPFNGMDASCYRKPQT